MPHLRTAKGNVLCIVFAVVAVLVTTGSVANSQTSTGQDLQISPPTLHGHLIPGQPAQQYPFSLEVLSSVPDKVNLNPYLKQVYVSIQHKLLANLPKSAFTGEKGVAVIRVHIEKDGSLPQGAVRIVSSSGNKDMDAAARTAIRTAGPFGAFPEGYGENLDLLFTFGFATPEPPRKPRVVPVGTSVIETTKSVPNGSKESLAFPSVKLFEAPAAAESRMSTR